MRLINAGRGAETMLGVNDRIGNYRVLELIATGSYGIVYRGEHIYFSNRVVAIKVLNTEALNDPSARSRFFQEAQFLEMLKHPYILPIVDISIHNDDMPYLVTTYAARGSLKDRIIPRNPMTLREGLKILTQIGEALQYIHDYTDKKHIIHRDLKPANILFNENDDALLADFGIATMLDTVGVKQGTVIGTYMYMAPEQFKGMISVKSDQYSLGCIAYEIFTGRKPFISASNDPTVWDHFHVHTQPKAPTQYNAALPLYVEQAILKAMSKQADERFDDVSAFIRALDVDDSIANMGTMIVQLPITPNLSLMPPIKDKQQWMKEGSEHYRAKRYEAALEAYKQATAIDPSFFHAYSLQGSVLYQSGRYEEALAAYEQAIKLHENFATAYNGKGNVLFSLKRYEDALLAFEEVIKRDANFAVVHDSKGNVLHSLGRTEEALAAYQEAILRDSNNALFYKHKGDVLFELERDEEALAAYEQASKIQHDFAAVYLYKGDVLAHLHRYEEALAAYKQALHFDATLVNAFLGKGNVLSLLNRNMEALSAYEEVLLLRPSHSAAYFGKGEVFSAMKLYTSALEAYERSIQFAPFTVPAYIRKGLVLCDMKRYQEALAIFEQAISISGDDASLYEQKGDVLSCLNRSQDALGAYEQAIQLNPRSATAYNGKGLTLWNLGRQQEAFAAFEQAEKVIQQVPASQPA